MFARVNMAVTAPSPRAQPEDKGRLLPYYPRQHALTIILPVPDWSS